jgi:class 3 adenylate cyclase/tetratricopeptide (TPR) repeat protein
MTVSAVSSSLQAFVPGPVVRRLAAAGGDLTSSEEVRQPGAVLFADISGFTPLAERLARHGARGAEELTALLNRVFSLLIEHIATHGGEVLKFAGDALLASWAADERAAAVSASACGLTLHAVVANAARAAGVELALRVGVGVGTLALLFVEGEDGRRECVVAGTPLNRAVAAEHRAEQGRTVLAPEVFGYVADRAVGRDVGDGFVELAEMPGELRARSVVGPAPEVAAAALEPFVNSAARARVAAGQADWLSELRRVTVLFVRFGVESDEGFLKTAQRAFATLTRVLLPFEATVDKLAVDDKGLVALAAFGLPPLAHPDDPVRAVSAALRLEEELRAAGLTADIGVATGTVFCGIVGGVRRREYTVIGDTVNLAARLMQHAEGGVLCDRATFEACAGAATQLGFGAPRILRLKGKAAPAEAWAPTLAVAPQTSERVFGVRETERAALSAALERLLAGEGTVIFVEGAPGLGKSELLHWFSSAAAARGCRVLAGGGDPIEQATPGLAWRSVFQALLGLVGADHQDRAARTAHIAPRRSADATLERLAPLLRDLLRLDIEDSELTAAMQGEVRAFNMQDLLLHLLRQESQSDATPGRPLTILIEDAQWLDSASWGLLRAVADRLNPVLLVVAGRPLAAPLAPLAAAVLERPGIVRLVLRPLSREETAVLLTGELGVRPAGALLESVFARSAGDPFLTSELAHALRVRSLVTVADGTAHLAAGVDLDGADALPDSVQAAVLARIDRLAPRPQLVLKVASVIGRSFPYGLARAIYPVEGDKAGLRTACEELVRHEFTVSEEPDPDPRWLYRQETTRQVAYNLLLFSQRRQLHRAVAEALEARTGGDLAPLYARLAWHWDQADQPARTLVYLEKAGIQAIREGAYQEGERAFRRALALLDADPALVPAAELQRRRGGWERLRGEALLGLGLLPEARAALERSVALLSFPLPRSSVGVVVALLGGALRQARFRFGVGRPRSLPAERQGELREAAQAYLRLIETYFFLAGPAETLNAALAAVNIAEAGGPSPELARAYALTGWILSMVPLFSLADRYLALAAALVARPEGRAALQPVRFFTGFTRVATGRWDESRAALTEAIELAERIGDKRRWIEGVCGISSPLHYQGEFERRVQLGREVLYASARRQGDFQAEAWGILDQIESLLAIGDVARYAPLLDDLEPFLAHDIGRSEQVWGHGMLALGRFSEGRAAAAWAEAVATNRAAAAMAPVAVYVFEGHAAAAEVLLSLAERGWDGVARCTLLHEAAVAVRELARYARVFPYARARKLSCQGRLRALRGRMGATRRLRAGVAEAVRIAMPLEEGIARLYLARHLRDAAEQARARAIFKRLGAEGWAGRAAEDSGATRE